MKYNTIQSFETAEFNEMSEPAGRYLYIPGQDPAEAKILGRDPNADFVGGVGVSLAVDITNGNGPVETRYVVTSSFKDMPEQAAQCLIEMHKQLIEPPEQHALSPALQHFKELTFDYNARASYDSGYRLIGGIAVHKSGEELSSGLFVSRALPIKVISDAKSLNIELNNYSKVCRPAPQGLRDIVRELPDNKEELFYQGIGRVMRSMITDRLPTEIELQRAVGLDRTPSAVTAKHEATTPPVLRLAEVA